MKHRSAILSPVALRPGRRLATSMAILMGPLLGSNAQATPPADKPNVVFILADDMGWGDVSRFGCRDYVTTNIDRIAAQGATLTHACAWPVCSPSRAAFLTGMDPKRVGVPAVLMPGNAGINTNSYSIAEHFRRNGYDTALIGKWHLGYTNNALPQARGFNTFFGFQGGQINYTNYYYSSGATYDLYDGTTNVAALYQGQYATTLFTEKAKQFITGATNAPFFLYLAYNAPHYPLYAPPAAMAKFTYIPFGNRRTFAAMVNVMDEGIGEILDLLASRGLSSNTIVWFTTDNGAMLNQGGSNSPWSGEKNSLSEGGIRLPAVVQWPGHIPAGLVSDIPFRIADVFPTLAGAVGDPVPPSLRLDGTNLWTLFTGAAVTNSRMLCYFNVGSFNDRAVIDDHWKLLNTNGVSMLFDLATDVPETNDLSSLEGARLALMESASSNSWDNLALGLYNTNTPPRIMKYRPAR